MAGDMGDQLRLALVDPTLSFEQYIHLKDISVDFIKTRPKSVLELVFKDDVGVNHKSNKFRGGDLVYWDLDTYVTAHTCATLTIQRALFRISVAQIEFEFKTNEFRDYSAVVVEDKNHRVTVNVKCGRSKSVGLSLFSDTKKAIESPGLLQLTDVTRFLGSQTRTNLASKVLRFLKLPQLAVALPPPTSERGYNVQYPAVHWLDDDILLGIFNCYRLDDEYLWNLQFLWCKLSHVCQRWRHLIYECAFHLGIHIKCTNRAPIVDTLDHLPPLPLFVDYGHSRDGINLTEQDESGIYHALRLRDRIRHINLGLPSSILLKVLVLMGEHFPILERLTLSLSDQNSTPLTLPKAFLAPNLRHLALFGIGLAKRLRALTSTDSLVRLQLSEIQASGYSRPRLLVARLRYLPHLADLYISFSVPIPRPSAERELLGEQGAPVTLPSLKKLWFKGVSAYMESLVAQIRVPLLEQLDITLFNQIAFALPHLSHLISITEGFTLPEATVNFYPDNVSVTTTSQGSAWSDVGPFFLRVMCKQLDWQIDCAAQICHALIPALSKIERLALIFFGRNIPTELQDGEIDSTTWHELLRLFVEVKELYIENVLLEELARALLVDEVGLDPTFLPNLQTITADDNRFTSFIETRQIIGRPVEFSGLPPSMSPALST